MGENIDLKGRLIQFHGRPNSSRGASINSIAEDVDSHDQYKYTGVGEYAGWMLIRHIVTVTSDPTNPTTPPPATKNDIVMYDEGVYIQNESGLWEKALPDVQDLINKGLIDINSDVASIKQTLDSTNHTGTLNGNDVLVTDATVKKSLNTGLDQLNSTISTVLSQKANISALSNLVDNTTFTNQLSTKANASDLANYTKTSDLNNTLSTYATTANLNSAISNTINTVNTSLSTLQAKSIYSDISNNVSSNISASSTFNIANVTKFSTKNAGTVDTIYDTSSGIWTVNKAGRIILDIRIRVKTPIIIATGNTIACDIWKAPGSSSTYIKIANLINNTTLASVAMNASIDLGNMGTQFNVLPQDKIAIFTYCLAGTLTLDTDPSFNWATLTLIPS